MGSQHVPAARSGRCWPGCAAVCWELPAACIMHSARGLQQGNFSSCWQTDGEQRGEQRACDSLVPSLGLGCQISPEVGWYRYHRDMNYTLLTFIKTFGAYNPAEMKISSARRDPEELTGFSANVSLNPQVTHIYFPQNVWLPGVWWPQAPAC